MGSDQVSEIAKRSAANVSVAGNTVVQVVIGVPVFSVIGLTTANQTPKITFTTLVMILGCACLQMTESFFFHSALHKARGLYRRKAAYITYVYYLYPVAALGALALFVDVDITNPVLLIVGAALIMAVNLAIQPVLGLRSTSAKVLV